jgi:hypothetical protein
MGMVEAGSAASGRNVEIEYRWGEDQRDTPEMIEAGADIIWRAFGDVVAYGSGTGRDVAVEVYQAMRNQLEK